MLFSCLDLEELFPLLGLLLSLPGDFFRGRVNVSSSSCLLLLLLLNATFSSLLLLLLLNRASSSWCSLSGSSRRWLLALFSSLFLPLLLGLLPCPLLPGREPGPLLAARSPPGYKYFSHISSCYGAVKADRTRARSRPVFLQ